MLIMTTSTLPSRRPRCLLAALLCAAAATPLAATSYVMVRDEALADTAPVAAVVRIAAADVGAGAAGARGGPPATEYTAEVEETLKGEVPGGVARVRVPGGLADGGLSLKIFGAPAFAVGERALLFLEPAGDGAFRILHLFLGAFHEVAAGGRRLAVRNLAEATEMQAGPGGIKILAGADALRDFARFSRWVAERARGGRGAADYLIDDTGGALRQLAEKFTLLDPGDGINMRWFDFDGGGTVSWRAHATGEQGLAGGGYAEFQRGLAVWTGAAQTPISYSYAGTTTAAAGFTKPDGVNAILFNDPNGDLSSFDCGNGGVLGAGGPWFENAATSFRGKQYHRIGEADIVINKGLACFFAASVNSSKAAEELFGHEVGHTLGLAHSCGDRVSPACSSSAAFNDALMRAYVHDDGRGARLGSDDIAGIQSLYSQPAGAPAAPTQLTATSLSTAQVQLNWKANSSDETSFRLEAAVLGGTFAEVGTAPARSTSAVVQGLQPATGYSFRIRAANATGNSAYSNEAAAATLGVVGPCIADSHALCLHGGRFRVQTQWRSDTNSGPASAVPIAANDSGLLWFFAPDNWELLVKVLNGCTLTSAYWVFLAATTDVEYTLTVTDTQTGKVGVYFHALHAAAQSVTDTGALASCP
jgi:hypothetical protein